MSDILKQIQALQEQFSNLFEVEGLGEPSSEVPPSTNKLKKDIKTKNGKVELVSVENELFPYDGNKKEQFQQKVLDTINGMIQGTATLEDLLQIVRQKKAPLKEAMEVLEELLSEGYNLHQVVARANAKKGHRFFKDNGLPKVSVSPEDIEKEEKLAKILGDKNKTKELADKALEIPDSKEYKKHVSGDARNIFVGGNTDSNLGYKDMVALSQDTNGSRAEERQINKSKGRHYRKLAKMNKSEALKEAMEVLEELIAEKESYVFPKKAVADGNAKYEKAYKDKVEATRLARKGFEKLNKKVKELEKKGIDTDVDIHPDITYVNGPKHEYQQALKTASDLHDKQREADRAETEAGHNQRKLRLAGLKGVTMGEFEPVPTKKGDNFKFKKVLNKNEALEEALEIMQSLVEATPFETKRRIADKFKDKAMDMYNKAAEKDMENSKKKVELHKKIHQQGGDVPAFAEDKIETFSDKPEVRKEQEEYNKLVDNGKKSGERVHKMNNFVNLVNYYKTPKNV